MIGATWNACIRHCLVALIGLFLTAFYPGTTLGMPPHPRLLDESAAKGVVDAVQLYLPEGKARAAGLGSPDDFFIKFLNRPQGLQVAQSASNFRILALLVDFSDHTASVAPNFFDSLIFDSVGNTINDYFQEISYGQLDIVTVHEPSTIGWNRLTYTYDYYVDGQRGIGTYPRNAQGLVADLVDLVDPAVDFSQYDNDGDGYVDILLVIHSGTAYEMSGDVNDIHSHKWALPTPKSKDGVYIRSYTIQPEFWLSPGDITIGVYAHELCHGFGLPDLYDTDYSSNGIGDWGIMSFGCWNGPDKLGGSPAHPCAWSRIQMGLTGAVEVTTSLIGEAIEAVEAGGLIYRLPILDTVSGEYFLIENRQRMGYDTYLPSSGLLIWHIDSNKPGNSQEWLPDQSGNYHFLVALEQADGQFNLEQSTIHGGNTGDAGDPFPGASNNTVFAATTSPNSDSYERGSSLNIVNNISMSGNTIRADLIAGSIAASMAAEEILPGTASLAQNYPNPFNPATMIEFSLEHPERIELSIYNLLGQKVKILFDGFMEQGTTSFQWDTTDEHGQQVASGIYLCKLSTGGVKLTRKMVLVR